jgi:uncharacterized protein
MRVGMLRLVGLRFAHGNFAQHDRALDERLMRMHEFAKFVVLQLLRGYKRAISPMFPPACRYVPTCSEYAIEAVDRYGALRGGWMAMVRLLCCHPFVKGGYDPVVKNSHPVADFSKTNPATRVGQPLSTSSGSRAV